MSKRGQASNETAMIIGFMVFFVIIFLAAVSDRLISASDDSLKQVVDDLADVVENELGLASSAQDGYVRTFSLPFTLAGLDYSISFTGASVTKANFTEFTINTSISGVQYYVSRVTPKNIVGTLAVGTNLLTKQNGLVSIMQPIT